MADSILNLINALRKKNLINKKPQLQTKLIISKKNNKNQIKNKIEKENHAKKKWEIEKGREK